MSLPTEEFTPEPSGELVHWMEPGALRVGPAGIAAALFVGLLAGLGAMAAFHWIAPRREGLPPWRWRRGPLH